MKWDVSNLSECQKFINKIYEEDTNIDEYVPIKTPRIIAKENPLRISPPNINIENKASNVVTEVIIVLASVSLIDRFAMSLIFNL